MIRGLLGRSVGVLSMCFLPGVALLAGCGDGEGAGNLEETGPADQRGRRSLASGASDRSITLATDTLYHIGITEDEHYFVRISSVGFDASGRLHVLDAEQHEVTTWDVGGRMVRSFGSAGYGPGEFQIPRTAYVWGNGTVAVLDIAHRALVTFDSAGQHVQNTRLPSGPVPGDRAAALEGARLVGPDEPWITIGDVTGDVQPVYLFSTGGDSLESELWFDAWQSTEEKTSFLPDLRIAALPDGEIVMADSAVGYRLQIIASDGTVGGILERPVAPWPVSEEAKSAERERLASQVSERQLARAREEMQSLMGIRFTNEVDMSSVQADYLAGLEDRRFASHIPVIHHLMTDWDGLIWVARSDSVGGEDGPIDLITADGGYVGTWQPGDLGLPLAFGPEGLMAYRRIDEFGRPSILVVRLRREKLE